MLALSFEEAEDIVQASCLWLRGFIVMIVTVIKVTIVLRNSKSFKGYGLIFR